MGKLGVCKLKGLRMKRGLIILWLFIIAIVCLALGFWIGDVHGKTKREAEMKAQIEINKENIESNFDAIEDHTEILEGVTRRFEALEKSRGFASLPDSSKWQLAEMWLLAKEMEIACTQ